MVSSVASERQIAANRRNAAKSTGPSTVEGKRRSSRNASRHGLSRPAPRDPASVTDIVAFAIELVGEDASAAEMALARAAAEAQFDLMRVRRARQSVLASLIQSVPSEEDGRHESNKPQVPDLIGRLDRYERKALCRRKKTLTKLARSMRLPIFG